MVNGISYMMSLVSWEEAAPDLRQYQAEGQVNASVQGVLADYQPALIGEYDTTKALNVLVALPDYLLLAPFEGVVFHSNLVSVAERPFHQVLLADG